MPQNTITLPGELVARAHEQGLTIDQLEALAAELVECHLQAEQEEARASLRAAHHQ